MKATLAILALISAFIAVSFAQTGQLCFSDEFHVDQATYDGSTNNNAYYQSKIWFSMFANKQRVDFYDIIKNGTNEKGLQYSWLFDYTSKNWYEVTYLNNTASCTVHTITGTMDRLCLARNAEHRGNVVLGGTLLAENWVEYVDEDKQRVQVDLLIAANVNVPMRVFTRDPTSFSQTEYWNYGEGVHHDIFNVPSVCQNAVKDEWPYSVSQKLSAVHPLAAKNPSLRIN